MITLPRVAARIFGEPLAIERRKLDVIVTAIGPRLQGMSMDDPEETAQRAAAAVGPDGIACIEVAGTLVARCTGMDAMSGLTSYADIVAEYSAAMENPAVRGVCLVFDTPGGEVKGMFEAAAQMNALRGQKPVCAVVDCAASAGYLLAAAAADAIVVSKAGITGSVGIIALHLDESAADEKAGLKYTAIYAGDRKNDGNPHEPLSPEARGDMQARVEKVYGMFVGAIAQYRGMSEEAVRKTQAAVYMGEDGVAVGFADAVGGPEDASRMLTGAVQRGDKALAASSFTSSAASAASSQKEGKMADKQAAAEAKVPTAEEIQAMVETARKDGFDAAAGISDLCAIAGVPARAVEFISARKSVADVRAELLAARVKAEKGTELNPSVMPGQAAEGAQDQGAAEVGKAKPWASVFSALRMRTKKQEGN